MNVAVADRLRAGVRLLRPSGPLPPLSWRGQIFDVILALGLGLAAILAGDDEGDVERRGPVVPFDPDHPVPGPARPVPEPFLPIEHDQAGLTVVMFLVVVLPLVFRRRYPLAVLWIVLGTAPLVSDYDAALRLSFYACVIAAYTAAVYSPYRVPALASLPVAAFLYTQIREPAVPTVPDNAVPFLILIPIAVAAIGLHRWKQHADEGRARLSTMEREQAEALRRAAEHERARIARELHDVVTHNVSVMVIQAGAARKVMQTEPDQAREALLAVEAGGRAAMAELRHVMGLLTMDSDDPDFAASTDLAPQPGLDRLEALVQRVRDTGIMVELSTSGEPRPVPPGVELTAYRVVQEALTNAVKHAAGASATVLVEYGVDLLRVEVTDTGGTPSASAGTGNGYGLIGLRERLAVYGGTLHTGRRLRGGYRVTALIPLEAL
ncbi:MAG TPA: sensor histidine kinase [Micromonosporaceae bacterium]|nr:sensor histidine kinase [Micromonosporaceae bacterium]HCU49938.1 sensor histidine kinase [Micromonosporaceae bacterium]